VCDDKGVNEDLGGFGCQVTSYLAQPIEIEVGGPHNQNCSVKSSHLTIALLKIKNLAKKRKECPNCAA
jgi:hypothetical protein